MPTAIELEPRELPNDIEESLRSLAPTNANGGRFFAWIDANLFSETAQMDRLLQLTRRWIRGVFTGDVPVPYDDAFEQTVKALLSETHRNAQVLARALAVLDDEGHAIEQAAGFRRAMDEIGHLLENWVSPRLSVAPGPRVEMDEPLRQQMQDRLRNLPVSS